MNEMELRTCAYHKNPRHLKSKVSVNKIGATVRDTSLAGFSSIQEVFTESNIIGYRIKLNNRILCRSKYKPKTKKMIAIHITTVELQGK
jgi:hypothetical protein